MKNKNKEVLISLINNLNDVEIALLRERIMSCANEVLSNKEEISKAKDCIINPTIYIKTMEKVLSHIDYKEEEE